MVKRSRQLLHADLYTRISDPASAAGLVDSIVLIPEEAALDNGTAAPKSSVWRVGVLRCVSVDNWKRVFVHLAPRVAGVTAFDQLPDPNRQLDEGVLSSRDLRLSKNSNDRVWLDPLKWDIFVCPNQSPVESLRELSTPELQTVSAVAEWSSCRECGYLVEAQSCEYDVIKCELCKGEFHGDCLLPFEKLPPPSQNHLSLGDHRTPDVWACPLCRRCACCEVSLSLQINQTSATKVYEPVLICQGCNLAVHGCCYYPRVPRLATGTQWRCDECRKCQSCEFETTMNKKTGEIDVGTWAYSYKQCLRCFQGQEKGEYCAVCLKAWSVNWGDELMVQCDNCQFWIHSKCDLVETERIKSLSHQTTEETEAVKDIRYHCPLCRDVSEKSRVLRVLDMLKAHDKQRYFTDPIHPHFLPIYQRVIKVPMCLSLMKDKVLKNEYGDLHQFVQDFALIITNAKTFNMPNTPPFRAAETFEKTGNNLIRKFVKLRSPVSSVGATNGSADGDRKEKRARVNRRHVAAEGAPTLCLSEGAHVDAEDEVTAIFGLQSTAFIRSPHLLAPISVCGSLLSFFVPALKNEEAEWKASEWVVRDVCAGCGAFATSAHPVEGCKLCGEAFHRGCAGLVTVPGVELGDRFVCRGCTRCRFCRVYFADDRTAQAGWTTCAGCGDAWHGRCKTKNGVEYVVNDVDVDGNDMRRVFCEQCVVVLAETRRTRHVCSACNSHGNGHQYWVSCVLCGKSTHAKCHKDWKDNQSASDLWGFDLCTDCTDFTIKEFLPDAQRPSVVDLIRESQLCISSKRDAITYDRILKLLLCMSPEATPAAASTLLDLIGRPDSLRTKLPEHDCDHPTFDNDETNFVALCLQNKESIFQGLLKNMSDTKLICGLRLFWRAFADSEEPVSACPEFVVDGGPPPSPLWTLWRDRWAAGRFLGVGFKKLVTDTAAGAGCSWPERNCGFCGRGTTEEALLGPLIPVGLLRWVHSECASWSLKVEPFSYGLRPLLTEVPVPCPPQKLGSADLTLMTPEWRDEVECALAQSVTSSCVYCNTGGASVVDATGKLVAHLPCVLLQGKELLVDVVRRTFRSVEVAVTSEAELDLETRMTSVKDRVKKLFDGCSLSLARPLVETEEGEAVSQIPAGTGLRTGAVTILSLGEWPGISGDTTVLPSNYAAVRVFWCSAFQARVLARGKAALRKRQAYLCRIGGDSQNGSRCTIQLLSESGVVGQLAGHGKTPDEAWQQLKRIFEFASTLSDISGAWFFGLEAPVVAKTTKARVLAEFRQLAIAKKPLWLRDFSLRSVVMNALGGFAADVKTRKSWRANVGEHAQLLDVRLEQLGVVDGSTLPSGVLSDDALIPLGDWAGVGTRLASKPGAVSRALEGLSVSTQFRVRSGIADSELLAVRSSKIHSNGLFARQDIRKGEMVVEYSGDLIRHSVADLREKQAIEAQEGADGSCYMFRLDDEFVVDATARGNCARFINHSCQPNCICKVVECDEKKRHIVIVAKHDIAKFDEITYDYQFAVESEKLLCSCGAPNCLGRLN